MHVVQSESERLSRMIYKWGSILFPWLRRLCKASESINILWWFVDTSKLLIKLQRAYHQWCQIQRIKK